MKNLTVQIFRRTVKDRRRGDSYKLLYDFAEGVKAVGDNVEIINEHMTGPTQDGEMNITAPIGVMFGYGGDISNSEIRNFSNGWLKKLSVVVAFILKSFNIPAPSDSGRGITLSSLGNEVKDLWILS